MTAPQTIPHAIIESGRRFGSAQAIVDPKNGVTRYCDLEAQILAAARAFIAKGIRRGERVALWASNMDRWIIATLALQAAGAVLVPLNTRMKGAEAAYILRASNARLLLTVSEFLGADYPAILATEDLPGLEEVVLLEGQRGGQDWRSFLAGGAVVGEDRARARLDELGAEDVCDILFTSGTTGRPKGVPTTHGQNLAVYRTYAFQMGWRAGDRLLSINPFFHSFGYKAGWLCALLNGATVLPEPVFDAASVLDRIEAEQITVLPGPPTIYQSLLEQPLEARDIASLRLAITGAAVVPVTLVQQMRDKLGFETVLTAYGLTETCGVVSMCSPSDDIETIANTAGRPIDGLKVRIVDKSGQEVVQGEPGEILVSGVGVMHGYLDDPAATAEAIDADGWLRTGDIGVLTDSGCISITDRHKDMIIVGGFNVYPAEIEQVLLLHPSIVEAAVVGKPDARMGEVGHAVVVIRTGAQLGHTEIIDWCRDRLSNYKVPRSISFVDALPRNASGKTEKFRLRS
ncbi:MAG: FadD3 family acyl-CoA ligase [Sphingomonadales bacterium]